MKPYTWRAAILKSGLQPTTRHVLLTLSCYINDVGQSAYPSIKTLAENTGLTERAVGTHLRLARDAGWLRVSKHGFGDQRWANNEYYPQIPNVEEYEEPAQLRERFPMEGEELDSLPFEKGQERRSEGEERGSKGQELRSCEVRNDVPTNRPLELSIELSNKDKREQAAPKFDPRSELLSLGIDEQIAADWLQHRKKKRADVTKTVLAEHIKQAALAGISLEDALRLVCNRGWTGFEADWIKPKQSRAAAAGGYESAKDRSRREASAKLTGRTNNDERSFIDIN